MVTALNPRCGFDGIARSGSAWAGGPPYVAEPRADVEHGRDDNAEEEPSIDDVIDADGQPVVGQVSDHDDQVCAQPVRNQRDQHGYAQEQRSPLPGSVAEVGEDTSAVDRCNQIAKAAARVHNGPMAAWDGELVALSKHRNACHSQRGLPQSRRSDRSSRE